jgi:hypothetical protein
MTALPEIWADSEITAWSSMRAVPLTLPEMTRA